MNTSKNLISSIQLIHQKDTDISPITLLKRLLCQCSIRQKLKCPTNVLLLTYIILMVLLPKLVISTPPGSSKSPKPEDIRIEFQKLKHYCQTKKHKWVTSKVRPWSQKAELFSKTTQMNKQLLNLDHFPKYQEHQEGKLKHQKQQTLLCFQEIFSLIAGIKFVGPTQMDIPKLNLETLMTYEYSCNIIAESILSEEKGKHFELTTLNTLLQQAQHVLTLSQKLTVKNLKQPIKEHKKRLVKAKQVLELSVTSLRQFIGTWKTSQHKQQEKQPGKLGETESVQEVAWAGFGVATKRKVTEDGDELGPSNIESQGQTSTSASTQLDNEPIAKRTRKSKNIQALHTRGHTVSHSHSHSHLLSHSPTSQKATSQKATSHTVSHTASHTKNHVTKQPQQPNQHSKGKSPS